MTATQPPFFRIPRELRDEIYELAYPHDGRDVVKIQSYTDRMRKFRLQIMLRDVGGSKSVKTSHLLSTCPLITMIVSKKYFEEASSAWFRVRTLTCSTTDQNLIARSPTLAAGLLKFSWEWEFKHCSTTDVALLQCCTSLHTLQLQVDDDVFDRCGGRLSSIHTFGETDFQTALLPPTLFRLSSLQNIELAPGKCSTANSESEHAKWCENVAALEAFLNVELKKKIAGENTILRPKALDPAVELASFHVSKLAPLYSDNGSDDEEAESTRAPSTHNDPKLKLESGNEIQTSKNDGLPGKVARLEKQLEDLTGKMKQMQLQIDLLSKPNAKSG